MKPYVCGRCGPTENILVYQRATGQTVRRCRPCRSAEAKRNYSSAKSAARHQRYKLQNREKLRASVTRWRKNNPEKHQIQYKRKAAKLRREIIDAYGGKCVCCGEANPYFLTIDHVENNGRNHRKQIGESNVYRWLRAQGFPKDKYQLMCANCNCSKGWFGFCPHAAIGSLYE